METMKKEFPMNKKIALFGLCALGAVAGAFAEGTSGFDPASFLGTAQTTVTAIVTAVGSLLAGALGLYLAFIGYRKAREALNKA